MPQPFRRVARLADLAPGTMKSVDLAGDAVLLVRHGDEITAIGGTCPHAGGPLGDGALDGEMVICPWHKAAFCTRTGRRLAPPAVDDVPRFRVETRDGEIWVAPAEPAAARPRRAARDPRCLAVLGGGGAGSAAVQTLREEGFEGRIVLLDREGVLPYDRTLLSKYTLSGMKGDEKTPLQNAAFYEEHAIDRRTAVIRGLNAAERRVTFADGSTLTYDAALIATGAEPRTSGLPGENLDGVFLLRSQADAMRIVAACASARHAVVIGAGFIGMEVAASLRERGLEVTVLARDASPFERQLGPRIGAVFRRRHESKGVAFRMQTGIARLEGSGRVERVTLDDGTGIAADIVVMGLGVKPVTAFVEDVGRMKDGGLQTDAYLRVAPGLYAAGDVAAFPLRGNGPTVRVEHWRVALQQGQFAAQNMLGMARRYDAVPVFWTIQYMKQLDYIGHASAKDRLVVRGNLGEDGEAPSFIAYYERDGRVAAVAGFDRGAEMAAVLALMSRQRDWTVDALHPAASSPAEVLSRVAVPT